MSFVIESPTGDDSLTHSFLCRNLHEAENCLQACDDKCQVCLETRYFLFAFVFIGITVITRDNFSRKVFFLLLMRYLDSSPNICLI